MDIYLVTTRLADLFAEAFIFDFLRYVFGAGGVYLVVNLSLSGLLAGRKIRPDYPRREQILREMAASFRTVLIFTAIGTGIGLGVEPGIFKVYFDVSDMGIPYLLVTTVVVIVLHDAYFYWLHVVLHRPRFFRYLHRTHHRSNNPTPFASYSFDAGEAIGQAIFSPLVLLVLPMHPIALLIFTSHMMLRNAMGHCGYELFPARRDGRPRFDWMTTVTHHDLHHANARWNIGLYFTWWDRLMGTEHPEYYAKFRQAVHKSTGQRNQIQPSGRELSNCRRLDVCKHCKYSTRCIPLPVAALTGDGAMTGAN